MTERSDAPLSEELSIGDIEHLEALIGMFPEDKSLLQGAAGEDAFSISDLARILHEFKLSKAVTLLCCKKNAPTPNRAHLAPNVDGQNFYELCQQYRHAQEMMPPGIPNVVQAFANLREYIKTGKLPWPSYESKDADCLTCHGDPAVCATVPGLRHCEKAMRDEQR